MAKLNKKPLAAALSAAFLAGTAASVVSADTNPFAATHLNSGYNLASYDKAEEGRCGAKAQTEGSCGAQQKAQAEEKAKAEGNCGAKVKAETEGKCGAEKKEAAAAKAKEGKCGEAKCGANKK